MSKNVTVHIDGGVIVISSNDGTVYEKSSSIPNGLVGQPIQKNHRMFKRSLSTMNRLRIMREVIYQLAKLEEEPIKTDRLSPSETRQLIKDLEPALKKLAEEDCECPKPCMSCESEKVGK